VSSPIWGSWPDIYYCLTVTVLFFWGALSEERTGLSFIFAADPRQRSLSRVGVPSDSWPYFTVSDSSTTAIKSQSYVTTNSSVGKSVLVPSTHLRPTTRSLLFVRQLQACWCGALSLTRGRVYRLYLLLAPGQHSNFWVRVPWDSWPYFTLSYSRLPFPSPPTTRRVTVEVFEPASTPTTSVILETSLYFLRTDHIENMTSIVDETCLLLLAYQ
jgi:hypothetical protein